MDQAQPCCPVKLDDACRSGLVSLTLSEQRLISLREYTRLGSRHECAVGAQSLPLIAESCIREYLRLLALFELKEGLADASDVLFGELAILLPDSCVGA